MVCGEEQLSYAELEARANRLAHHLIGLGVGPEVVVGLSVQRSVEMVVCLLGILKAGGAYLPLEPDYPLQRLQYMVSDAGMKVLLTQRDSELVECSQVAVVYMDTLSQLLSSQPCSAPQSAVCAQNLLYVMYTSGSTG